VCGPDQYEVSVAEATKDTVCGDLTRCESHEYRLPVDKSFERKCKTLQICDKDAEFESSPPQSDGDEFVSDRVCSPLTTCNNTEKEQQEPTLYDDMYVTDRVCVRACDFCTDDAKWQYWYDAKAQQCQKVTSADACAYDEWLLPPADPYTQDHECRRPQHPGREEVLSKPCERDKPEKMLI
jgi:hypothetical protein